MNTTAITDPRSPRAAPTFEHAQLTLSSRLNSIDLLRGLVMVIMALDHMRDFLTNAHFDPTDLSRTTSAYFLTRWVTHFCAPVFMFLAGAGASLYQNRGRTTSDVARFLVTRGLWLILLEFTVVRFGWWFNFQAGVPFLVLWALGVSMIALGAIVFLPRSLVGVLSIVMIAGHNLLDGLPAERFGAWAPLWNLLHEPGLIRIAGHDCLVLYCAIPWVGVMAAGYAFCPFLTSRAPGGQRTVLRVGLILTALFIVVRTISVYGDPAPWSRQNSAAFTVWSFLNTTKYPPSLCFLLMTLGPAIAALGLIKNTAGPIARFLVTFGRVPMFFYILHIYLGHAIAVGLGMAQGFSLLTMRQAFTQMPDSFGLGLPAVYLAWIVIVLLLYMPCRWFAEYKRTHHAAWLSYV